MLLTPLISIPTPKITTMNRLILFLLLLPVQILNAQDNLSALLPLPNHIEQRQGSYHLSSNVKISPSTAELQFATEQLQQVFKQRFGINLNTGKNGKIRLLLNPKLKKTSSTGLR